MFSGHPQNALPVQLSLRSVNHMRNVSAIETLPSRDKEFRGD
jgi:hypothetical protein